MANRTRTWRIVGSACLYVTLVVLLMNSAMRQGLILFGTGTAMSAGGVRPTDDDGVPLPALNYPERALAAKIPELNKISPLSIQRAAGVFESLKGVDQSRQYAPKPGVAGTFDHNSTALYDIAKATRGPKTVYQFTVVDRDGRSMVLDVDESAMTPDDLAAFRVYEMARSNPRLRILVDSANRIASQTQPGRDGK
jgi:hypothetical protein